MESLLIFLTILLLNNALWMYFFITLHTGTAPKLFAKTKKESEPDFVELEDAPLDELRDFIAKEKEEVIE